MGELFFHNGFFDSLDVIGSGSESEIIKLGSKVLKYFYPELRNGKDNIEEVIKLKQLKDYITLPTDIVFEEKDFVGFLMDYAGINLLEYFLNNSISLNDKIIILNKVKECLMKIHDMNYVHGDIKPANILISNDGTIKICDINNLMKSGNERMYLNDMTLYLSKYYGFTKDLDIQSFNYFTYVLLSMGEEEMNYHLAEGVFGYGDLNLSSLDSSLYDDKVFEEQMTYLLKPSSFDKNSSSSKYLLDYLK